MSLTLARFMWRSNLSFGTNFLRLDFRMLFVNVLIKYLCFTSLQFAQQDSAGLNYTLVRFAPLCLDITILYYTIHGYTRLNPTPRCLTMFGYNFALLSFTQLLVAQLCLDATLLSCAMPYRTILGFASLCHVWI